MGKNVSLKDIAAKVGVSTALVSYVLNNKNTDRINSQTKEKIKKVAKEFNYQPNQIAKSLKTKKTDTIGLIVADIANPFFAQLARIIEDEAGKYGYSLIIGSSDENVEKSEKIMNLFIKKQVDGCIIAPVENTEDQIRYLIDQEMPLVLIDRKYPQLNVSNVTINNAEISFDVTETLIAKGRKNIAIFTYNEQLSDLMDRVKGYEEAMLKHKLQPIKRYLRQANLSKDIEKSITELLDTNEEPINAIFFTSNKVAFAGLKVLQRKGIKIPEEIAVISFDESEAFDLFYAPISCVRQPLHDIGHSAVELLTEQIAGKSDGMKQIELKAEIKFRESTDN